MIHNEIIVMCQLVHIHIPVLSIREKFGTFANEVFCFSNVNIWLLKFVVRFIVKNYCLLTLLTFSTLWASIIYWWKKIQIPFGASLPYKSNCSCLLRKVDLITLHQFFQKLHIYLCHIAAICHFNMHHSRFVFHRVRFRDKDKMTLNVKEESIVKEIFKAHLHNL